MFSNSTSLNGKFSPLLTGHEQSDEDQLTFDEGMLYSTLIQFWKTTEISSYSSLITERMKKQRNYSDAPITLESSENQVLGAWGLASITAAEVNYPELDNTSSWLQMAARMGKVLSSQSWDANACEGGLRWDRDLYQKDALSNGLFFQLAARLAHATGGNRYEKKEQKVASEYNRKILHRKVMTEFGPWGSYGTDETIDNTMKSMVGLLSSSLAAVANLLPETAEQIAPRLRPTAIAAAKQCSGTANGTVCGSEWTKPTYDGNPGLGSSMGAVNLFVSILMLPEDQEKKLSDREIAGIAVGSGAGVALIATAIFLIVRRRRNCKKRTVSDSEYSPCHSARSEDVSGVTNCSHDVIERAPDDTSELPASKDGSMARHELDAIGRAIG
ncbi:uncharacterized protein KD926_001874 [Aspergillus affinis]|uniref:uncharacterized protein n=1 Tax=Aspergillus affinis TaxID=1070780 RepID=UPI0022FDDC3F|nr:uncharacterized protein KD926_001874 [Aspergillus affinis]KAI9044052.1 hypothetical protein KD926_001874 [Aspergillus affinis]